MEEKNYFKVRKNLVAVLFCFLFVFAFAAFFSCPLSYEAIAEDEPFKLTVMSGDKKYIYIDNKIKAPDHMIEEEIFNRRINSPLKQKMKFVDSLIKRGLTMADAIKVAFPKMESFMNQILTSVNKSAVNSEIIFSPSSKDIFSYTLEQEGVLCDERRLYQDVYLTLKERSDQPIFLIKRTVAPLVTRKINIDKTKLIASFSTSFASSKSDRQHNIILALSKINGTVVFPNEAISFNETVGERSEKNGFRMAKIIVEGKYVEGIGGGVCQVSTTLYNAAIRAGMDTVEVHNHSLVPSYVPPSLDAMVSGKYADLIMKNVSQNPIFVRAYAKNNTAIVEVFSSKLAFRISPQSRVIFKGEVPCDDEIIDVDNLYVPPLSPPKTRVRVSYGVPEIKSEAYLVYYDDRNTEVGRKFLRRDCYKSQAGIIAVSPEGTAENVG